MCRLLREADSKTSEQEADECSKGRHLKALESQTSKEQHLVNCEVQSKENSNVHLEATVLCGECDLKPDVEARYVVHIQL